ncbi:MULTISPECIES: TIGR02281 family clan AA aspartic protease [unclassified Pseudomonas]|uniref:retropepsin-like aspartic protease family protein n=1 Tax=unclassified Pseudomonas TaxID=196821 RepID=UPI001EFBABA0|nr:MULTISPECIES: TIGR02281 family clan AA aspartic protease [unclassified Pseudomonas]MCG8909145.1 TIGR02281 family clan AA aspartic protease [Pseudomonas sp. DP-17]MDU4250901.1 TIGR02281 family clan AA aspartic protease [Pseudomonas sp.]
MRLSALICLSLCSVAAVAAPQIRVVGLFPGAAVLNIDGQRKLVKVGQTGPEGVQVVSADSHKAVLRVGGVEQTYELSREYSGAGYAAPSARTEMGIARGTGGHYWVAGTINNQNAQFLVDTGATSVAMNEGQARRLGIDYRASGTPMMASTASGTAKGWRVTLNSVKLGGVEVLGVEAVVLEGDFPTDILLGMSYLNRVGWREDQGMMYIQAKH